MKFQLKSVEQLHEQARLELEKQTHERTQERTETNAQIAELIAKLVEHKFFISLFSKKMFPFLIIDNN